MAEKILKDESVGEGGEGTVEMAPVVEGKQVASLKNDTNEFSDLARKNIELCERNKIHRMAIYEWRKRVWELENQLRDEQEQREAIESDRILFLNFISELKTENRSLQVSINYRFCWSV